MISKSSFSSLLKEDIKTKMWIVLVNIILLFLNFPIVMAIKVQAVAENVKAGVYANEKAVDILTYYIGGRNAATVVLTVLVASVAGVAQFGYLYQKNQVDFYHSLPISRQKYFMVRFVNGMLMYILSYVLFCMLGLAVVCAFGYGQMAIVRAAFLGLLINMIGYLLCYATAILAVCLTGNLFTGVCGILTFQGYGFVVALFVKRMVILSSDTYMFYYGKLDELSNFISPLGAYIKLSDAMNEESSSQVLLWLFGCIITGCLLTLISGWVYLKRKSESAGKSIAFEKGKGIIKVFLMVLILGCGTLFFYSIVYTSTTMWSIIGFVITFILAQIMIQIIFEMDIRGIKLGIRSALVSAVIAGGIFGGFYLGGRYYDTYQINWEQMEYAAVYSSVSNGYIGNYYDAERGCYIGGEGYVFEHMKIHDIELMKNITKDCIDSDNDQGYLISVDFKYTLKNGKKVYRNYRIDYNIFKEYILQLLDKEEYRMGSMPIYSTNLEVVNKIGYYDLGEEDRKRNLDMTSAEIVDLLEGYKEEYLSASVEELNQNVPVTSLVLGTEEWDLTTIYVYPSFEKTIGKLKEKGMELKSLDDVNIAEITVKWLNDKKEDDIRVMEVTYTEAEKIQELRECLCLAEYGNCTAFDGDYALKYNYSILLEVTEEDLGTSQQGAVFIKAIPEWLKEDMKNAEIQQEIEDTEQ